MTLTYSYPVSGSTAPTAVQINGNAPHNVVTGTINFADTDTFATITHNFGNLAAGQGEGQTESAKEFPIPTIWALAFGTATSTVVQQFSWSYISGNAVGLTKVSATNTGGTYAFSLMRPGSLQR